MSIDSEFHHTVEVLNNSLRPLRSKNEELEQFQSKKPHFVLKKNTNRLIKVPILHCNKCPFLSNTEVGVSHRYSLPQKLAEKSTI